MLKQKIVSVMQSSFPGISNDMSEWKVQEIIDFQEELRRKVNAYISEKWFYNHCKRDDRPLPRIDMLNMLSRYTGYLNWDDFLYRNSPGTNRTIMINRSNRMFIYLPLIVLIIALALLQTYRLISHREYRFTFYDALTKEPVAGNKIAVSILSDKDTPQNYLTDSLGVFVLKTDKRYINMVVSALYFKTDTIHRTLKTFERNQKIGLQSDDFARMILFISEMNLQDWQKRRSSLDSIIDSNAMIYQVGKGNTHLGIELFTKNEFINKLTMPAGSLKNLEILETKLFKGKISILKFRIK